MSIVYTVVGSEAYVGTNDGTNLNGLSPKEISSCPETINIMESYTYSGSSYFVTRICAKAFYNCATLSALSGGKTKYIIIHRSVKVIEQSAFYGSYNIQSVTFHPYSCLSIIEKEAFRNLGSNFKTISLKLPSSITTIENNAFWFSEISEIYFGGTTVLTNPQYANSNPKVYTVSSYSGTSFLGWTVTAKTHVDSIGICIFPTTPLPPRTAFPPRTISATPSVVPRTPFPPRTVSATPSERPTKSGSASPSPSLSVSPTFSPKPSPTNSQSISATPTESLSASQSEAPTESVPSSQTPTASLSEEPSPSYSADRSPEPSQGAPEGPVQCSNAEKEKGSIFPIFFLIDPCSPFGRFKVKVDL